VWRFVTLIGVFCAGAATGIVGLLAASREPIAWLKIVNHSSQPLKSVCVSEDRFKSRYCIDGSLALRASVQIPVIARGEVGYTIAIVFEDGTQLKREFYAETGYQVEHVVSATEISYDPSPY